MHAFPRTRYLHCVLKLPVLLIITKWASSNLLQSHTPILCTLVYVTPRYMPIMEKKWELLLALTQCQRRSNNYGPNSSRGRNIWWNWHRHLSFDILRWCQALWPELQEQKTEYIAIFLVWLFPVLSTNWLQEAKPLLSDCAGLWIFPQKFHVFFTWELRFLGGDGAKTGPNLAFRRLPLGICTLLL